MSPYQLPARVCVRERERETDRQTDRQTESISYMEPAHVKRDLIYGFLVCGSSNTHLQSPVWGLQTCVVCLKFPKVPTTYMRTANNEGSGETVFKHRLAEPLLVAYVKRSVFSYAGLTEERPQLRDKGFPRQRKKKS